MSHEEDNAHVIKPSKPAKEGGGGGMKWLAGAAVAVLLAGGGYYAWKTMSPGQSDTQTAYNDGYSPTDPYDSEPSNAGPLPQDESTTADTASADESPAPASSSATRTTPRRSTPARTEVPEETIGITPINATTEESANIGDGEDLVVTAARRPVWSRTPTARRLSALYPQQQLDRRREGEARLACIVQDGGALDCENVSSTPGFGSAALRVARTFRHSTQLADGSDATGSPVNLRVVFRMEDETRRG
jgi:hypothetical protein